MSPTNEEKHQETYAAAEKAVRALDPEDVARRAGAVWVSGGPGAGRIEMEVLGGRVIIEWPELSFEAEPPLARLFPWRLIALHHLAMATGAQPGEDWISYRELPDGLFYANTITREVEEPLARAYATNHDLFIAAGAPLGAVPAGIADASLLFHPLPRMPVVFALWVEDEEFPAKVKVLYERAAVRGLPLQDLRILADLIGGSLKAAAPRPE